MQCALPTVVLEKMKGELCPTVTAEIWAMIAEHYAAWKGREEDCFLIRCDHGYKMQIVCRKSRAWPLALQEWEDEGCRHGDFDEPRWYYHYTGEIGGREPYSFVVKYLDLIERDGADILMRYLGGELTDDLRQSLEFQRWQLGITRNLLKRADNHPFFDSHQPTFEASRIAEWALQSGEIDVAELVREARAWAMSGGPDEDECSIRVATEVKLSELLQREYARRELWYSCYDAAEMILAAMDADSPASRFLPPEMSHHDDN